MTRGAAKIYQASFCKKDNIFSVNIVFIHLWFNGIFCMSIICIQPRYIYFSIKMPYIGDNGFIIHQAEMLFSKDAEISGGSNDYIRTWNSVFHFLYFKAIHCSL